MRGVFFLFLPVLLVLLPSHALAIVSEAHQTADSAELMTHWAGIFCLVVFVISYAAVLTEEQHHMRKSKPVMFGAGVIWMTIGFIAPQYGISHEQMRAAIFHGLDEYAGLLLFLLAAMTYIAALQERRVFATLRVKLVQAGLNTRQLFVVTGIVAFFLSPIADNLTTALVLGAVVMAVGGNDPRFVAISCVNVVNAANAGGAFSPFGDITTLMVWQAGKVEFFTFFQLFFPALVCFLIPMALMYPFVPKGMPWSMKESMSMKRGARAIIFLGLCTIAMAVAFEQFLGLPPFLGMMTGLSLLMFMSYYLRMTGKGADKDFDILELVASAEWDTLLFFFGVIFSVGGLAFLGYLEFASTAMYDGWGATITNIILGAASAVIDNIPVMFAVLSMSPEMGVDQWLLITLTTGVGGSMLSIGSAAGVALMGVARGQYTFLSHLKWTPILALGYIGAVGTHIWLNM